MNSGEFESEFSGAEGSFSGERRSGIRLGGGRNQ